MARACCPRLFFWTQSLNRIPLARDTNRGYRSAIEEQVAGACLLLFSYGDVPSSSSALIASSVRLPTPSFSKMAWR